MGATPPVPAGQLLIEAYGGGMFRIAGEVHRGSVIVLPDAVVAWAADVARLAVADFAAVLAVFPPPEILLIGCGRRAALVPSAIRQRLREAGIVVEAMDTGAACRTYNVLLAEARRVAAVLIAVD